MSIRASGFAVLAVIVALVAVNLAALVPDDWAKLLGNDAVEGILKIVASSMLIVVTFSLSTMVSAYATASQGVTPRAAQLLMEDNQSQNALSIFLGAFIFSIVSIIALSTGYYGKGGIFILFIFTVLLVTLIVWTIIRWIEKLSKLGRVHETIRKVEEVTNDALSQLVNHSIYCCQNYVDLPKEGTRLNLEQVGYLQAIQFNLLQKVAKKNKLRVYVDIEVGCYCSLDRIVAVIINKTNLPPNIKVIKEIQDCFDIGSTRLFENDPRFGLIVLGEVASRALSPAVNDPGTAIDVIGSMIRLFTNYSQMDIPNQRNCIFDRVYTKDFDCCVFYDDIVRPISRDGAGHIEVAIRLYKALKRFQQLDNLKIKDCAINFQKKLIERAEQTLSFEDDRIVFKNIVKMH